MPFAYYGAKHGLAPRYPPPVGSVIVEPFAGSAAYSIYHAHRIRHAILFDCDPVIIDAWHRLQHDPDILEHLDDEIAGDRTSDIIIAGLASETSKYANRTITNRMREAWPSVRERIRRALPYITTWDVKLGAYHDAPPIEATWFVDPPYQMNGLGRERDSAGNRYSMGADRIDFVALAAWCRTRRGLTIVCEQSPASWLPFSPLAVQANNDGRARTEVIWRNDAEQHPLF